MANGYLSRTFFFFGVRIRGEVIPVIPDILALKRFVFSRDFLLLRPFCLCHSNQFLFLTKRGKHHIIYLLQHKRFKRNTNTMSSLSMLREPANQVFLSSKHMISRTATKATLANSQNGFQKLRQAFGDRRSKKSIQESPLPCISGIVNPIGTSSNTGVTLPRPEGDLSSMNELFSFASYDLYNSIPKLNNDECIRFISLSN